MKTRGTRSEEGEEEEEEESGHWPDTTTRETDGDEESLGDEEEEAEEEEGEGGSSGKLLVRARDSVKRKGDFPAAGGRSAGALRLSAGIWANTSPARLSPSQRHAPRGTPPGHKGAP